MIMIYTSYFGKVKRIEAADPDAVLIPVCGKVGTWCAQKKNVCCLKDAAPRWAWWQEWHEKFKDDLESEESVKWYSEKYKTTVLDKLDRDEMLEWIAKTAGEHNAYLLCYETPEKFCHRHLLAAWLNEKPGVNIQEWNEQ